MTAYELRISDWSSDVCSSDVACYDAEAARRFWRGLIQVDRVFKLFRSGFLCKVSPVRFFWGSFDLAVTRFPGRPAPLHPGGVPGLPDRVTREAYSHEEIGRAHV